METLKTCNGCFSNYDPKERAPRVLPCGHSLCSKCLVDLMNKPKFQKCPFDGITFAHSQNSLACFPLNFIVMDLLEQKRNDVCRVHPDGKLKYLCLTDKKKICEECVKNEEHNGHRIKKIKALKAQGSKAEGELQESLLKIEECEQEKNEDCDRTRKVFVHRVCEKIRELEDILVEKEFEWIQQVNNLFDTEKKNNFESLSTLKQQMKETIEKMTYACEDDGDLALLDKEISNNSQSISKMRPELLKEKLSQVKTKAFDMQKTFEKSLNTSKMALKSLQLPSKGFIKEIYFPQEEGNQLYSTLMAVKFTSYFDINNAFTGLEISTGSFLPKEIKVNHYDFQEIEKVFIQFKRYDMLRQEPQRGVISYILHGLKRFTSLDVSFTPNGFHKTSLMWFGCVISDHLGDLRSFDLDLEKCKFSRESMQILYENVFSKMNNVQNFYLNCKSSKVNNDDLRILAKSLKVFNKNLEFFALGLAKNDIDDDGINQVFENIKSMEALKDLQLILLRTRITDLSLEIFGAETLPYLQSLDSLTLCLKKNGISDRGVLSILKSLPSLKNLKRLELYLSDTLITDKTVELLVGEVIPRLESLKHLTFIAKNTQISKKDFWEIHKVSELIIKKEER